MSDERQKVAFAVVAHARKTHRMMLVISYMLLMLASGFGALMLWFVLDDLVLGKPWSAAYSAAVALWNGKIFVDVRADQRHMRARMAQLEKAVERLNV